MSDRFPVTPDGRYFVVGTRLWRRSDPALSAEERGRLVAELMRARREVKEALASDDPKRLRTARARVQRAKVALGERGPVWWSDGAPDFNQRSVLRTPYRDWFRNLDGGAG